jgi:hypothetical protein
VVKLQGNDFEFDLVGVDASIANALRRIMLAEVCWLVNRHASLGLCAPRQHGAPHGVVTVVGTCDWIGTVAGPELCD